MAAVLWLCFKLPSCLFSNTNDTSVMHAKVKFVCFIYMQVKFFVQINMKHVLYFDWLNQKVHFVTSLSIYILKYRNNLV